MKSVLILEDIESTRSALAKAVREVRGDIEVYAVDTLDKAYALAFTKNITVFMVDIILTVKQPNDTSGIKFIQQIREHAKYMFTPVIFISKLEDPKFYAFCKLHSYAYIEKPFSMEEVKAVFEDAIRYPGSIKNSELCMRNDGILYPVKPEDVIYVECEQKLLHIYTINGCINIPNVPMKKLLKELEESGASFQQCNRHTIVNWKYIENIDLVNRYIAFKNSDRALDIGFSFKRQLRKNFINV